MQVLREHRGHLACSLGLMVSKVFLEGARVTTVFGGGAGSSTHLSPSPCPSVRGGGFLAAYGRVCLPLVLARWELALLGEQEERV